MTNKRNYMLPQTRFSKVILGILICLGMIQLSCSNNAKNSEVAAREHDDSIRVADSIRMVESVRTERELYRKRAKERIDSLQAELDKNDAIYSKKTTKVKETWTVERNGMKTRIESLKQRTDETGDVTKDKWNQFKAETDTGMQHLKTDWNKLLDKMKAKK